MVYSHDFRLDDRCGFDNEYVNNCYQLRNAWYIIYIYIYMELHS